MLTVELLVKLSDKNINELAKEAGIRPSVLSDLLHHRGNRRWSKYYVEKISKALGVDSSMLVATVSDRDIIDLVEEKSKAGDVEFNTSLPTPIHRPKKAAAPDYALAEAAGLKIFPDIYEADGRVAIPIHPQPIAASPPDVLAENEEKVPAWIDLRRGRIHGAKARAIRVSGTSMNRRGIDPGDVLFVRLQANAPDDSIVVAALDGGVTIKVKKGDKLYPDSDDHKAHYDMLEDCKILGVVWGIHKPK